MLSETRDVEYKEMEPKEVFPMKFHASNQEQFKDDFLLIYKNF